MEDTIIASSGVENEAKAPFVAVRSPVQSTPTSRQFALKLKNEQLEKER